MNNNKSTYLNHVRTIHRKVRNYCKIHRLHDNPIESKINPLFKVFLNHIGEEIPNSMSLKDYMLILYRDRKYSFLSAILSRPDIPPKVWKELRVRVLNEYGHHCLKCNVEEDITIDHIKPYSLYPELCIEFDNLQPLCRSCNSTKGLKVIDYRYN